MVLIVTTTGKLKSCYSVLIQGLTIDKDPKKILGGEENSLMRNGGKKEKTREHFMQKHQHPTNTTAPPEKPQVITEAPVNLLNGSIFVSSHPFFTLSITLITNRPL